MYKKSVPLTWVVCFRYLYYQNYKEKKEFSFGISWDAFIQTIKATEPFQNDTLSDVPNLGPSAICILPKFYTSSFFLLIFILFHPNLTQIGRTCWIAIQEVKNSTHKYVETE